MRGPLIAAPVAGLDFARCIAPYEGVARELVIRLKFSARARLAGPAATVLAGALAGSVSWLGQAVVQPVPAAPARRRARGHDPAAALAARLAVGLGLELADCLSRADGPRQVGRRRSERLLDPPRVRIRGAAPQHVILVDDVITTGATVAACAIVLRAAGARRVGAVAIARA